MKHHPGHQERIITLPTRLCLISMAAALALCLMGAIIMASDQPAPEPGAGLKQATEISHGEHFMPTVLQERAQRSYDAAASGDGNTLWNMMHQSEQSRYSPMGITAAVNEGEGPMAGHTAWRVKTALVWYGEYIGATSASAADGSWTEMVWTRDDDGSQWLARPDCNPAQADGTPEQGGEATGQRRRKPSA